MMDKDEIIRTESVNPRIIICRTCKHRNSGQTYPHFTKAHCAVYREGVAVKPSSVLFEGDNCTFYEKG